MRFIAILPLVVSRSLVVAGPINILRSSLIPTPPPACVGKTSNSPLINSTALPNLSNSTTTFNSTDLSNTTALSNTTTTTFLNPSNLPDLTNSTAPSNTTSSGNSTNQANSTNLGNSTLTVSDAATSTGSGTVSGSLTSVGTSTVSSDSTTTSVPPTPTSTDYNSPRAIVPKWLLMRVPKFRRIAQSDLPAVAQSWQNLCLASGGDIITNSPCVQLAGVNGINALLADADPCAQQDNADAMIDFAKSTGVTNGPALIANAVAYRQHSRNAIDMGGVTPSTPYCQKAPKNVELQGVVNDQLDGVDPGIFGGPNSPLVAFGDDGTCPFGQTPDASTCSCTSSGFTEQGNSTDVSNSASTSNTTTILDPNDLPDLSNSTSSGNTTDQGNSTESGNVTLTGSDAANSTVADTDSADSTSTANSATSSDSIDQGNDTDGSDSTSTSDTTDTGNGSDSSTITSSESDAESTGSATSTDPSASAATTPMSTDYNSPRDASIY